MKPDTQADIAPIEKRAKAIQDWLKENGRECFDEQKHLDQGSTERIYWHYGYLVALRDVYRFMTSQRIPTQARRTQRRGKRTSSPSAWRDE
ncbi:MAG TPA: hypothetical protein VIW67_07015 [Terriglobales bacterium]|jgi:hypothetical protein